MENEAFLIILKDDKILTCKDTLNRIVLPSLKLNSNSDEETQVLNFLNKKFNTLPSKILRYTSPQNFSSNGAQYPHYLLDYSNSKLDDLNGFDNLSLVKSLPFRSLDALEGIVKECIKEDYTSSAIEELKEELFNNSFDKKYFKEYEMDLLQKKVDNNVSLNKKVLSIIGALILGFFYKDFAFSYSGVSYSLFTLMIILYYSLTINTINSKNIIGVFITISSILLSITFGIYTNPVLRGINHILLPLLTALSLITLTYKNIWDNPSMVLKVFRIKVFRESFSNSLKLPKLIFSLGKNSFKNKPSSNINNIKNGLIISIPVVFILTLLLTSADSVFAFYLKNITDIFSNRDMSNIYKIIALVLSSLYIFGLTWSLRYKNLSYNNRKKKKTFHPVTLITICLIVTLLYITFTIVQLTYLYGGNHESIPGGLSYAEYAREGFFHLAFIALINVLGIFIIKVRTMFTMENHSKILNSLLSIITLLTFNMLFSALYKMNLYINVFAYTRLRVLVSIFLIFLAISLVMLLVYIWKSFNIIKFVFTLGLVFYLGINFFNMDKFIASKNIEIYSKSGNGDLWYLSELSYDAMDPIKKAYDEKIIDYDIYTTWKSNNKIDTSSKWHETNYYESKSRTLD